MMSVSRDKCLQNNGGLCESLIFQLVKDQTMDNNNEEKQLGDLDRKIGEEKKEIKDLESVLARERDELHHLEDKRREIEGQHEQEIIVNTRGVKYPEKEISYRKVVLLAFHDAVFDGRFTYTVEFSHGPEQNPKGSMTDGGKDVFVKNKMVFDVERADKS
jgi:hypothetical protein